MMDCLEKTDLCGIHVNERVIYDIEFTDSDGAVVDVYGMKLIFTAKLNVDSDDNKVGDIKVSTVMDTEEASIGKFALEIPSIKTASLLPGRLMQYDIKIIDNGSISTVSYGEFKVLPSVPKVM